MKKVIRSNEPGSLPIILIAYNRPDHTQKVVDALRLLGASNLYIFSDAPRTAEQEEGVKETRAIFNSINWTRPKIELLQENRGLAGNIRAAVNYVFESEDELILLEDDCVPHIYFLKYVFDCLNHYKENPRVYGISGYNIPVPREIRETYPYDVYMVPRIGSWGWSTWKDRWNQHSLDLQGLVNACLERGVDLTQGGSDILPSLSALLKGELKDVWTLHWLLTVYLNSGYYIYPTISHINNIGMDGTGVHCGTTDKYDTELASKPSVRLPDKILIDDNLYRHFRLYHDMSNTTDEDVQQSLAVLKSFL